MSTTERRTSTISDVQARSPSVALSLSRVGVTGVEKVIRLRHDGAEQLEGFDAGEIDAATLLTIIEQSMSSESYELMKRSDEAHVVEKAHAPPTHTSRQAWLADTP